ncbi:MAG: dihydrofolate reductase [Candidatus Margulisiibacteriota bacterium]
MKFDIVVAHDLNHGIGINNQLPWHSKVDMMHFKTLTTGINGQNNAVIMGRKTWESIPEKFRPLPDRTNIVLSKSTQCIENAMAAASFEQALTLAESHDRIFVIGGSQIYEEAIAHPKCHQLHVTKIFKTFDCDAFFPNYKDNFRCLFASNIAVSATLNCGFFKYVKL